MQIDQFKLSRREQKFLNVIIASISAAASATPSHNEDTGELGAAANLLMIQCVLKLRYSKNSSIQNFLLTSP